ncbi:hypothetical protein C6A77_15690 [Pseudomonas sp. AFG_SD02_1510_Pfu_092]|nr:hypothetical protein C6A77_15690 [Pseudomonas sp. AFG_SD02_1510_Pfu_092]
MSRKGCIAAPATYASQLKSRGRVAALSRHKAAPTGIAQAFRFEQDSCPISSGVNCFTRCNYDVPGTAILCSASGY